MARKCSLIYSIPLKWVVGLYIKPSSLLIMDWLFLVALRYNYLSEWKNSWVARLKYRLADFVQTRRLNNFHGSFSCINTVGTYPAAGYSPVYITYVWSIETDTDYGFSANAQTVLGWTVFTSLFFPEMFWIRTWLRRMFMEGRIKTNIRESSSSCIHILGWQRQYQVTWMPKKN